MRRAIMNRCWLAVIATWLAACAAATAAEPGVLGAYFRADEPFPDYAIYWHEGWTTPEGEIDNARYEGFKEPLGGSVHVFIKNTTAKPLAIEDVLLDGISLKQTIVFSEQRKNRKPASIYFAKLPKDRMDRLLALGEPIWWKAEPLQIAPGRVGEVIVRLRQMPKRPSLPLALRHAGGTIDVSVPVQGKHPRVVGASFSPDRDRLYVYFRHQGRPGAAPMKILIDEVDVTESATIGRDPGADVAPVVIRLPRAMEPASFHCVQGVYDDGVTASAGVRVWADEFAYGMWGGKPGKGDDLTVGRNYVTELVAHNINVQMPQVGSPAVQTFYKSEAGQRHLKALDFRAVIDEHQKWGQKDPHLYFIHDEPDCADFRFEGIPENKKIGALASWTIQRSNELRAEDPAKLQLLNLDMTYKPQNWYIYGQVPDVLAADPYYQNRLRTAYQEHNERIKVYSKATYVYAVADVCQSACEPNPLHIILYSCSHVDNKAKRRFRFPTPPEKRIEVFYALAAGAKGLSYWWYTPADQGDKSAYGVGAAIEDGDPAAAALYREIGLLGAEVRTAGPLFLRSCPAEVPVETKGAIWTRTLLAGLDSLVLLVVNDQYTNHDKGTDIRPVEKAVASIKVPAWLKAADAFEVTSQGTKDVKWTSAGAQAQLDLGKVDVTRLVMITADKGLRAELQKRYTEQFAGRAKALLQQGAGPARLRK